MMGRKLTGSQKALVCAIRKILHEKWDPFSIAEFNGPLDEYESNVWQVFRMVSANAPASAIAECLLIMETRLTAQTPNKERAFAAADALVHASRPESF